MYKEISNKKNAPLAQLAERCSYQALVEGSNPSGSIFSNFLFKIGKI